MRTSVIAYFTLWANLVYSTIHAQSISNLSSKAIVTFEHFEDSISFREIVPGRNLIVYSFKRNKEYFTPSDTNRRDCLSLDGKTFILDSLIGEFVSNYTMSYTVLDGYLLTINSVDYFILYGGDTFFNMNGSDPPVYLIFCNRDDEWIHYKTYYLSNDEALSKVSIRCKKNRITLSGRNLVREKHPACH